MKKAIVIVLLLFGQNPASGQGWFELGTGSQALNANENILSICSDTGGNIYAAGAFTDSFGGAGKRYVAKWDCIAHQWSELGNTDSNKLKANWFINTITTDKFGNVYAAGVFTDGSSFTTGYRYVAKWNAATESWSELGTGSYALNANSAINSICVDKIGNVYAAGNFRDASGFSYVAKWNGTYWSELNGLNANLFINSICVDDSLNVYAGGDFTDSNSHTYIAKWNNTTGIWSEIGSGFVAAGLGIEINSIFVDSSHHIFAALIFDTGTLFSQVYKWDGISWSQLGSLNANNQISVICMGDSGFVYVTGQFTNSDGKSYVAKYNPQTNLWMELGGTGSSGLNPHSPGYGNDPPIFALCTDKFNNIFVAGAFTDSISHSNDYMYVAEYGNSSLGIKVIQEDNNNIEVYPNPAHNEINIFFSGNQLTLDYSLYDCLGRVYKKGILNVSSVDNTKINISDLPCGLYILQINEQIFNVIKK